MASLVATHVTVIDIATRQTGSLLGRSTHWIKPASPPVVCLALSLLPPSYKGAKPLVESPRRGAHSLRNSQAGVTRPCAPCACLAGDCAGSSINRHEKRGRVGVGRLLC